MVAAAPQGMALMHQAQQHQQRPQLLWNAACATAGQGTPVYQPPSSCVGGAVSQGTAAVSARGRTGSWGTRRCASQSWVQRSSLQGKGRHDPGAFRPLGKPQCACCHLCHNLSACCLATWITPWKPQCRCPWGSKTSFRTEGWLNPGMNSSNAGVYHVSNINVVQVVVSAQVQCLQGRLDLHCPAA
jgi:hypothetical protein